MLFLTAMMYHYVRDADDPAPGMAGLRAEPTAPTLSVEIFQTHLDEFARRYEMVSWADVRAVLQGERTLSERACLLTFDDGTSDHYLNVYPAMRARGMSGLFFAMAHPPGELVLPHKLHYLLTLLGAEALRARIWARLSDEERAGLEAAEAGYRARGYSETNVLKAALQREFELLVDPWLSEWLEAEVGSEAELARQLYLQPEQVREMRAGGMHFGGHSRTHPWFDYIDAARREREIRASAEWLAPIEQPPYAFAYPYGGLADDAPQKLNAAGFRAAFTTRAQTTHSDPFQIGRLDGEEVTV